jgi:hypothetical protein
MIKFYLIEEEKKYHQNDYQNLKVLVCLDNQYILMVLK